MRLHNITESLQCIRRMDRIRAQQNMYLGLIKPLLLKLIQVSICLQLLQTTVDLLQQVNAGLERLQANGELNTLEQEWFGRP